MLHFNRMKWLLCCFMFASPIFGQSVAIQNPSFEVSTNITFSTPCGNAPATTTVTAWNLAILGGGSGGAIQWSCETIPDGKNVAFLTAGSTMSQDLQVLPQFGVYTMKFWIANWFYAYPATYTASLTIGGKPVCTTGGFGLGDFTEVTLVCPVSNYISVYHNFGFSGNLGIFVDTQYNADNGWPLLFDNISLTFTPTN